MRVYQLELHMEALERANKRKVQFRSTPPPPPVAKRRFPSPPTDEELPTPPRVEDITATVPAPTVEETAIVLEENAEDEEAPPARQS